MNTSFSFYQPQHLEYVSYEMVFESQPTQLTYVGFGSAGAERTALMDQPLRISLDIRREDFIPVSADYRWLRLELHLISAPQDSPVTPSSYHTVTSVTMDAIFKNGGWYGEAEIRSINTNVSAGVYRFEAILMSDNTITTPQVMDSILSRYFLLSD